MRAGNYTLDEVQVLLENWLELRESRRQFVRVRVMDLTRSIPRLPLPLRQAVVLHGQFGYSLRAVGTMVGTSPMTILRRYNNGLEQLVTAMNGGG